MNTLYLCGAGNPDAVRLALAVNRGAARWDRVVLLDDNKALLGQRLLGVEIVGGIDQLAHAKPHASQVANLVARTTLRRWTLRRRLAQYGLEPASLVHPAVDTLGATLAADLVIYDTAYIGPMTTIGDGSVIFAGAAVGHGSNVGECCVVGPGAVINARVRLGPGVYVGTNAAILPEVKVGAWATIGAGSVATTDVPAGATVLGVPGRIVYRLPANALQARVAERTTPQPALSPVGSP